MSVATLTPPDVLTSGRRSTLPRTLARLDALLVLVASVTLAIQHIGEIRWGPFVLFFASIDLIGYLPGAIAHRRAGGRPVHRVFPALYDLTHGFPWNALVAGAWCLAVRPEWALIAIPIHLAGDRSLFGNFFKALDEPFEPAHAAAEVTT